MLKSGHIFVPSGTVDNSLAIHRWEQANYILESRQGRLNLCRTKFQSSLAGLETLFDANPAMNRWAIVTSPFGTLLISVQTSETNDNFAHACCLTKSNLTVLCRLVNKFVSEVKEAEFRFSTSGFVMMFAKRKRKFTRRENPHGTRHKCADISFRYFPSRASDTR